MSEPNLLNPNPADALMAQHARDGWAKLRELEAEHAGTLAKLERMREALERALHDMGQVPHDEHCFTNDPNPDACCCVCGKDSAMEQMNDALIDAALEDTK